MAERPRRASRARAALALALGLSTAPAAPLSLPAAGPAAAAVPDSLLSDTLNRWPGARPNGPAPAVSDRPAASLDSAGPAASPPARPPRGQADSLGDRERLLNTLTGSHQKAAPLRWRERPPYPGAPLLLTLPAADFPFALEGGVESPSMRQSLLLTASATQWADQTVAWLWSGASSDFLRDLGTFASLALLSWASDYAPLGESWLHEEWHRAVLTRRGIDSYDGVYHWDIGAGSISVDHVEDRDLAALKDRHPAEFTRLMEAGGEGEIEGVRLMRRRNFFLGRPSYPDRIAWWTSGLNLSAYLYLCSVDDAEGGLDRSNAEEADPRQRDFTGLDFRAWVYDLRHPDEPYAAGPRGRTHPSGTGFDRYLRYGDLTADERGFLKLQAGLSLLNEVSGQHLGWDWLPGVNPFSGQGFLWNFGLTHHLTPFGYAVGGELLARQGKADWVFTALAQAGASLVLPCLGAELFRYPLAAGRKTFYLSASASAWLQPERQRFRATAAEPGAYGLLGLAFPLGQSLEVFAEGDAKTAGWVPGVVYLDPAAEGRAGIQIRL